MWGAHNGFRYMRVAAVDEKSARMEPVLPEGDGWVRGWVRDVAGRTSRIRLDRLLTDTKVYALVEDVT